MTRRALQLLAAVAAALVYVSSEGQVAIDGTWLRISEDEREPETVGGRPEGVGSDASRQESAYEAALNDAARLASNSNPGRHSRIEDQCLMYPPEFVMVGSFPRAVLVSQEGDRGNGEPRFYRLRGDRMAERIVWMDGRSQPSKNSRHTASGFSVGHWDGDVLVVETTHLQWFWEERSNVPYSDKRRLIERFVRAGDVLTHTITTDDPVFLTRPITRSRQFRVAAENVELPDQRCSITLELAAQPRGYVPHNLPRAESSPTR